MKALTIRQPWAWAIVHGGKTIENRTWQTFYRGPLAIHAGTGVGNRWEFESALESVAGRCGLPPQAVAHLSRVRGSVIAIAELADVCADCLYSAHTAPLRCECGTWAVNGQRHLRLTEVRALPEPVPARGALGLWSLPPDVAAAVRTQVDGGRS
ncbi:ASCH domain-containing protein [Thermomonospora umbrina]|uniref:ASCH domain-containing protein n=1 Tax=Thermomonospora umbrina TaxID=111806 RepID=A0A3D9T0B8_9ACTN|nr:ASCH domain-containing protein [Thermomonospora umbrina]REF00241.1 ASCH domain-containing protein [Thermomonospora umbrina]